MDPMPHDIAPELKHHVAGVQGTFWCENIGTNEMMEYMAMPRLMCIAETGWTARERKDFDNFQSRMRLDTVMLNLGGYEYGRHYISETPITYEPKDSTATPEIISKRLNALRIEEGDTYRFENTIPALLNTGICYNGTSKYIQHSTGIDDSYLWVAKEVRNNPDGSQTVKFKNKKYGKFMGNNPKQQGRSMWPVFAEAEGQDVVVTFRPEYGDYTLSINGKELVPIGIGAEKLGGVITSGNCGIDANVTYPARHIQGSAWRIIQEISR